MIIAMCDVDVYAVHFGCGASVKKDSIDSTSVSINKNNNNINLIERIE